jgi:CheY-like chemotaxis protein
MPTFLVVDDDPSIRIMFARSLAELGEVDQAEGGRQAIQLLSTHRYEAVLLDLHMPGVDGFAVLEALAKEDNMNRETPVFVVTGDTSEQSRVRAVKLRSLLLLTKPVPLAMIRSLVESSVKSKQRSPTPSPPRGRQLAGNHQGGK